MKHVFLIDGSGFIFRAYHALPPMTRPDGTPVNAVYGFTAMLLKLVEETDADHIAVIFDRARKTFRSDIYPEYKAHRPPPPDDLIPQFELVRQATRAMGLKAVDMEGFEADDLIATYARQAVEAGADVTIVSSDKDLMQLVNDKVTMMDAMKNKIIGVREVEEKFGVGPDRVVDVQALAGDSADNVPGVEGIGLKTAAQLIVEFGSLEAVLENAPSIKQVKRREKLIEQADRARISKQLVTLRNDVPVDVPLDDFDVCEPDVSLLLAFLKEQAFKSLFAKVQGRGVSIGDNGNAKAAKAAAPMPAQRDYVLVQTEADLQAWIDDAFSAGQVTVDTETTGLDAMTAKLVGVSLCIEPGRACYVPLAHKGAAAQGGFDFGDGGGGDAGGDAPQQVPLNRALEMLKPLLSDPGVLKIGQNIKYDLLVLKKYDIDIAPVDDTMVISYVLESGLHGHGMDELAGLHLGLETIKFKDVAGSGKTQITFDHVALDKALDYAAEDADVTAKLYRVLKPRLVAEGLTSVYETLERPLISILVDMEYAGIKVDAAELKRLSDDFARRLNDLEVEIHKLAGEPFNIASPKQLGEILFDRLGLEGGKKGKTGAYATGAEVLDELAAQGHELPARVLDWRQLAKLKSTYTDALMAQINAETQRVHTSYAMAATSTGRLASSDPNLQNIPIRTEEGRKIRHAFVAKPGCKLLSADYSQIELRLLAHVADIGQLKEAFHQGLDIHAMTASEVFGVPLEGMDPMVRRSAKAINFGIIYGISAFGLARQLGISRSEAADYIKAYFEKFPGIQRYMNDTKAFAAKHGFVTTLFGRRCHAPGINDKNPMMRGFAERAAINAPIQGGAADIIKRAMVRLPDALERAGLKDKARMLLQVHDELIFEVDEAALEQTRDVVVNIMEGAATLDVPLVVDVGVGDNWGEAH
jgi:DNA polymerase-1